jgi:hypothetical protein
VLKNGRVSFRSTLFQLMARVMGTELPPHIEICKTLEEKQVELQGKQGVGHSVSSTHVQPT